jgi:hypothetical protein
MANVQNVPAGGAARPGRPRKKPTTSGPAMPLRPAWTRAATSPLTPRHRNAKQTS